MRPGGLKQWVSQLTSIRPRESKLTIGLDLGSSSIKVVALGPRKGLGARPLLAQKSHPFDQSTEADPSGVIKSVLGSLHLPVKSVNLAVSGAWVIMRIVEMPAMKPGEMRQALPFEAQRYLPFNLQDVVLDGVVLGPSEANKNWVLIVACKKELIERRIDWLKRAGFEVDIIDVDALALANSFLASQGRVNAEQTTALVDLGTQLSNLVIFKGQSPYLVRDIPWGGDKLMRSIGEALNTDPKDLQQLWSKGEMHAQQSEAMKSATESLITELQLSFDYFENRFGQPPEQIFLSGGLIFVPGLVDAVKSHLTQGVSVWAPLKELTSQFSVAYGLALRSN